MKECFGHAMAQKISHVELAQIVMLRTNCDDCALQGLAVFECTIENLWNRAHNISWHQATLWYERMFWARNGTENVTC